MKIEKANIKIIIYYSIHYCVFKKNVMLLELREYRKITAVDLHYL